MKEQRNRETEKQRNELSFFVSLCSDVRRRRSGFTLVEFLIYIGLLSIFLVILTDIFVSIIDLKLESESVSAVEQDERFLVARLTYDVNRASAITTPASLGAMSDNLVLVINGVTITYAVSNGNLERTDNVTTNRLNGSETIISNPSFQRIGNSGGKPTVKIQLTITSRAERPGVGFEVRMASTTAGLR